MDLNMLQTALGTAKIRSVFRSQRRNGSHRGAQPCSTIWVPLSARVNSVGDHRHAARLYVYFEWLMGPLLTYYYLQSSIQTVSALCNATTMRSSLKSAISVFRRPNKFSLPAVAPGFMFSTPEKVTIHLSRIYLHRRNFVKSRHQPKIIISAL